MNGYPDDVPNCPTCKRPLRVKHLPDGRWACWCVVGTNGCETRASRLFRPTKLEAIAAWLNPAVNALSNRLPRPRKPKQSHEGAPKKKHVMVEVDNYPRCFCGLRIFEAGAEDCGGPHLGIMDHIRSGLPAGGFINLR